MAQKTLPRRSAQRTARLRDLGIGSEYEGLDFKRLQLSLFGNYSPNTIQHCSIRFASRVETSVSKPETYYFVGLPKGGCQKSLTGRNENALDFPPR